MNRVIVWLLVVSSLLASLSARPLSEFGLLRDYRKEAEQTAPLTLKQKQDILTQIRNMFRVIHSIYKNLNFPFY
jgi:hypothetical protein